MELKQPWNSTLGQAHLSLNRTFMELKRTNGEMKKAMRKVLIEPLWN